MWYSEKKKRLSKKGEKMTRRDYEQLARLFYVLVKDDDITERGFNWFCNQLEAQNANFKRSQFEKSCGVTTGGEYEK